MSFPLSDSFILKRGTRQGCLLSQILLALSIEPLAMAIRNNKNIAGIPVGQLSSTISLFGDDLLVTLTNPKTPLEALLTTLQEFGDISGLLVSQSKTYAYPLNILATMQTELGKFFSFKWVRSTLPYLGIQIPLNLQNLLTANFTPLLNKISAEFKRWDTLILSWFNRLQLIKSVLNLSTCSGPYR